MKHTALKQQSGFSLIELLIVVAVILLVTGTASYYYDRDRYGKSELFRAAQLFVNNLRHAQTLASSGSRYVGGGPNGPYYCGYGLTYVVANMVSNPKTYYLYGGWNPNYATETCAQYVSKKYDQLGPRGVSGDDVLKTYKITSTNVEFRAPFNDTFYEIPFPRAYIYSGGAGGIYTIPLQTIVLHLTGTVTCSASTCISICVFSSGRIDIQDGDICPIPTPAVPL